MHCSPPQVVVWGPGATEVCRLGPRPFALLRELVPIRHRSASIAATGERQGTLSERSVGAALHALEWPTGGAGVGRQKPCVQLNPAAHDPLLHALAQTKFFWSCDRQFFDTHWRSAVHATPSCSCNAQDATLYPPIVAA